MKRTALFLAFLSLLFVGTAFAAESINTDAVVIKNAARILKIAPERLRVELPFARQNPPGDALDIVEIVMAVEDDLGIEISDQELDTRAGSQSIKDAAQKLTIKHIQQLAGELYRKKHAKLSSKGKVPPSLQVKP